MKKILASLGLALFATSVVSFSASATEAPTPPDIGEYCEDVYSTVPNPAYVPAIEQWFSWTGGQSETHPFPGEGWNPDNGNHNGQPFQGHVNEAFQVSQGNSSNWFYLQSSPAVGEPTLQEKTGEDCTVWVTWLAPGWYPNATDSSNIGWDQSFVGLGQIAPTLCETTHQQDLYIGSRSAIDAILLDRTLTGPNPPEDNGVVEDWVIVSTGACPVEPVPTSLATPTVKDLCGWSNDHYGLPANTAGVTYSRDGRAILASITGGYTLPVVPAGWVAADGGYRYAFNFELFDDSTPCLVQPLADRETRAIEAEPTCEAITVATWTEERGRLYTYLIEAELWTPGEWSGWTVVADSQSTRELTVEELAELDCPTDEPPVTPPTPPSLASTGGDLTGAFLALGLTVAGALALRLRRALI